MTPLRVESSQGQHWQRAAVQCSKHSSCLSLLYNGLFWALSNPGAPARWDGDDASGHGHPEFIGAFIVTNPGNPGPICTEKQII